MRISAAEQTDFDAMKEKQQELKLDAFDLMREYLRMDATSLRSCGHRTVEEAVLSTVRVTLKDCDKVAKDFLKKWPD